MREGVKPLELPDDFDSEVSTGQDRQERHVSRVAQGAALAARLAANGTAQDLTLAERVLDAVLRCQERRADDPHHDNFLWMWKDQVVEDLNAVQSNLEHLLPMWRR